MVNYGLKDKVALITGANNPQGIGATTAFAFAREGAKVVLIYKKSIGSSTNRRQTRTVWTGISRQTQGMLIVLRAG